jgi:hypothetical protein
MGKGRGEDGLSLHETTSLHCRGRSAPRSPTRPTLRPGVQAVRLLPLRPCSLHPTFEPLPRCPPLVWSPPRIRLPGPGRRPSVLWCRRRWRPLRPLSPHLLLSPRSPWTLRKLSSLPTLSGPPSLLLSSPNPSTNLLRHCHPFRSHPPPLPLLPLPPSPMVPLPRLC